MDAFLHWIGSNQNPLLLCTITLLIGLILYICQLIEWVSVTFTKIAKVCFGYKIFKNSSDQLPTNVKFCNNKTSDGVLVEASTVIPDKLASTPSVLPSTLPMLDNPSCTSDSENSVRRISGDCSLQK